jgi:superfamily II DNA/RNA helicase
MLDMGFIPDVERIVGLLPKIRQTLFFSATMPPEIRRLADAFLMNPKEVAVTPPTSPAETVVQSLVRASALPKEKRAALRALIDHEAVTSALIFCNRKRDVGILYRSLKRHGYSVAELHGDMAQPVRTATLKGFKDGEVKFLVCSDVAARGLDIPKVSHVFNFDVPVHAEDYIHRIGRTGRAGRSGLAVTMTTPADRKALAAVTRLIGRSIDEARPEAGGQAAPAAAEPPVEAEADQVAKGRRSEVNGRAKRGEARGQAKQAKSRGSKSRREAKPDATPSRPTKSFGDHTPAFMLREVKLAASA